MQDRWSGFRLTRDWYLLHKTQVEFSLSFHHHILNLEDIRILPIHPRLFHLSTNRVVVVGNYLSEFVEVVD